MTNDCQDKSIENYSKEELANINQILQNQIKTAKKSSTLMAKLSTIEKNQALNLIEKALRESIPQILEANQKDLEANPDLSIALKDRLRLDFNRINSMANGIKKIIDMPDPVGNILDGWKHPQGMQISKIRVPLGVIGIIYEARPNVTTDAIALAIKSGNAVVLRGSSQAYYTNLALISVINQSLKQSSVPSEAIQFLQDKSRHCCLAILKAAGLVDLVIPRGGEALNNFVLENSIIPVLGAGGGNCHIYIDEYMPEKDLILKLCLNAKISRPSVCNSAETILIHKKSLEILPDLIQAFKDAGVSIRADKIIYDKFSSSVELAEDLDWSTEYLDLIIALKVVDNIEQAIDHINLYSTAHSESIISNNSASINKFKQEINSACVYVNVSTRFTDGEEFGFGAEMGISTQKLHARGPIGAKELCTYKYIIEGEGQIR